MEGVDNFSLRSMGSSGDFTVEMLCRSDHEYFLSVDSLNWSFDFQLVDHDSLGELASFLHSQFGRTAFADLVIGSFGGEIVHIIKDDEFADRFFLRAAGSGTLIDFTLVDRQAQDFAAAVTEAADEFAEKA